MATENERLHENLFQTEKDTIEVVTFLKKGDIEKEEEVPNAEQCFLSGFNELVLKGALDHTSGKL